MVKAPQHGQRLQDAKNAGANVEDMFHANLWLRLFNMVPDSGKNKECN